MCWRDKNKHGKPTTHSTHQTQSTQMKSHLQSRTHDYLAWTNMKRRCLNPKNIRYHRYGGRGIKVCPAWISSYEQFIADMGPSNGLTLDRIDNDGDYEPDNCRWVPMSEQGKKTSRIRNLTHDGQTHSVSEWARRTGISRNVLNMRLNAYGWTIERALSIGAQS